MNLQSRVTNILTKPAAEWAVIASEPADVAGLYRDYIAILAAIPPVCMFIGWALLPFFGVGLALSGVIMSYVRSLVAVFIAAIIIEKLAPRFSSSGNTVQALKLVAYASTPVWIGGVVYLIAFLAPLMLVAVLYAVYLFYLGVGPVMKTPQDKAVPFTAVSVVAMIVVNLVLQLLVNMIAGLPGYGRIY